MIQTELVDYDGHLTLRTAGRGPVPGWPVEIRGAGMTGKNELVSIRVNQVQAKKLIHELTQLLEESAVG